MSRLSMAYLCWAIGGIFGFHHLYMGRLTHAIFFSITLGFFGIGWIYDFFQISTYVQQANSDPIYLGLLRKKIRERPSPSFPRALSLYVSAYCSAHLSLTILGPIEPIEARIGDVLSALPIWWLFATSVTQIIAILVGCLLINSVGGQHTVSKSYLVLPIIFGTICDIAFAIILNSRTMVVCRALLPTIFYLRSCEWLPSCASPKPRYFTSITRGIKIFIPYLAMTLFCFAMILGSVYFYCDVFVNNDGSIEYSDTNYGIGFPSQSIFSHLTWDTPSFKPSNSHNNNPAVKNTNNNNLHNTTNNSNNQRHHETMVDLRTDTQSQYTYTQFRSEIDQFWTSSQLNKNENKNQNISSLVDHFSLPFSYRFRDILRNIYFSSILQPVHSEINYYDPTYRPGSDPLFHRFAFPTTFTISSFLDQFLSQTYSRVMFISQCVYYFWVNSNEFTQQSGIPELITELDITGHSWATSFITYINNGVVVNGKVPLSLNEIEKLKSVVAEFILNTIQSTNGDVSRLRYWQQKAIYDTIVAYGRLNPQRRI